MGNLRGETPRERVLGSEYGTEVGFLLWNVPDGKIYGLIEGSPLGDAIWSRIYNCGRVLLMEISDVKVYSELDGSNLGETLGAESGTEICSSVVRSYGEVSSSVESSVENVDENIEGSRLGA